MPGHYLFLLVIGLVLGFIFYQGFKYFWNRADIYDNLSKVNAMKEKSKIIKKQALKKKEVEEDKKTIETFDELTKKL